MRRPITAFALAGAFASSRPPPEPRRLPPGSPRSRSSPSMAATHPRAAHRQAGGCGGRREGRREPAPGNCLGCHQVSSLKGESFHGEVGPSLDGVAGRWDAAHLRMIVVNPKHVFTEATVMPAFYRIDGLHRVRAEFQASRS